MKIGDQSQNLQIEKYLNTQGVNNHQNKQPENSQQQAAAQIKTDTVQLSSRSKLLNKVQSSASSQEMQRAERLQMIKEQVQNGTYEVDAEKVANAMLKDLIKDLG